MVFQMNMIDRTYVFVYLIHYISTNVAFLDQIITGDETFLQHVTLRTKTDFMVWRHNDSSPHPPPPQKKKFKTVYLMPRIMTLSYGMLKILCWWTWSTEVRLHAAHYCNTPDRLMEAVQIMRL